MYSIDLNSDIGEVSVRISWEMMKQSFSRLRQLM